METQSRHWPNLLRTVIQELIKNSSKLNLLTLVEGISLMSKLFSRLSPSFNQSELSGGVLTSPLPQQQQSSDESSFSFSDATDGIGHCTELSKTLFSNFVKEVVLKHEANLILVINNEGSDIDFNKLPKQGSMELVNSDDENTDYSIRSNIAETFQVFCQYLVKVSCFPFTSPTQEAGKSKIFQKSNEINIYN